MAVTSPNSPVTKVLNLNDFGLENVPRERRSAVKSEVGEFVVEQILQFTGSAKTSVKRGSYKATLDGEYAAREKGGNRRANLELEGDMLSSLDFTSGSGDQIEVGIFDRSQTPKAFNHTTGDTLPQRQFITSESEDFRREIESGIRAIIREESVPTTATTTPRPSSVEDITPTTSQVLLEDLFSDNFIQELFNGQG